MLLLWSLSAKLTIPLTNISKTDAEKSKSKNYDAEQNRDHWSNPCDFFVSCLGYAVGLGNIWRFPLLCFKHGGGSFLMIYSLMLVFAGLPIFFLEMALGQYAGVGPIKIFGRIAPLLQGLGYVSLR